MKNGESRGSCRLKWRGLMLASLIWLGLEASVAPESRPAEAGAQSKRTAAYVYDRASLKLNDADAAYLDQMNFSFALIKNGELSGSHWSSISKFKAYMAKHPSITPVLSVGGWGADGFSQAASTAEGRKRFAASAVKLMREHGFMGLDVDWEYPCSSVAGIASAHDDKENFTLLLRELRSALDALAAEDGTPRLLAIAISGDPSALRNIECAAVGELVDQINVMTYDLQVYGAASHHTPLYSSNSAYPLSVDGAVKACINAGLPAGKLMVGAAFYGRVFTLKSADNALPFAPATDGGSKTLIYDKIRDGAGWDYRYDDKAQAAYAVKGKQLVSYDNADSIIKKGEYAASKGLMGVMCWEYGGDSSGELVKAMREGLK